MVCWHQIWDVAQLFMFFQCINFEFIVILVVFSYNAESSNQRLFCADVSRIL